ncbi:MAG: DUF6305 family protein [Firmicutes bacterium]|nr:DUF6305 family protein [Bacillota bacterium]
MSRRRSIICVTAILAMVGIMMTSGVMAAPKSGKPALITSAGQSTDGLILRTILTNKKTGETVPFEKLAKPEDLEGIRTLIVSVGLSTKGLGAAGVNVDQEKARVRSLLDVAKKDGIFVMMVHVGGTSRRGKGSDEFATLVADYAHHILVVKTGNDDGFFTRLAQAKKIPLTEVDDRLAIGAPIMDLLNTK